MSFYDEYKPFRNYMRRFELIEGLTDIWRYSLNITENIPLPSDYVAGSNSFQFSQIRKTLHPWDFDILAKELVLNAGKQRDRSLKTWDHLAKAINFVHGLDGIAYTNAGGEPSDIFFELHRIGQRQFPWQIDKGMAPMMRAFKVFGRAAVDEIIIRELGMTAKQLQLLGVAISGHFRRQAGMSTAQDYEVLGISREASKAFFDRMTSTTNQLRAETTKRQSYDRDWLYTWNPLEAKPLVSFDPAHPDRVLCPIPRYLLRRTSGGIFFDLVKAAGFDNPYGDSFQSYVGEVIAATCPPPRFTALAEDPYYVGRMKKHGVDWVLSDSTGHLFIECKTKRLTLDARTLSDTAALDKDLIVMAQAIVQHYRNIKDALDGKTAWVSDGLPIFPLILTLEDWFIFSSRVAGILQDHVSRLIADTNISEAIVTEMPYTIGSAHEFEITSQLIAQLAIAPVMTKKTAPDRLGYSLFPFVRNDFPEQMQKVNERLFSDEWSKLMPDTTVD